MRQNENQQYLAEALRILEKALNGQITKAGLCWRSVSFAQARESFLQLQRTLDSMNHMSPVPVTFSKIQSLQRGKDNRVKTFLEHLLNWRMKSDFFVKHLIIHGSLATKDITNYSDVDALLVVADETLMDEQLFKQARQSILQMTKHILDFDPLQHHGFHLIPESLVGKYPQFYLPISVFDDARVVGEPEILTLVFKPCVTGQFVQHTLRRLLSHLSQTKKKPKSIYNAKLFLSSFMLVPALLLQAEEITISKRQSFDEFKKRFTLAEWEPMAWATHIRNEWPRFELSQVERAALVVCNPWLVSRILLMRRPLPQFFAKEWTPQRHAALLEFVRLASRRVKLDPGIFCEVA